MNNIVFQNPEDQEWETFQKEIAAEVNQIRISSVVEDILQAVVQ